MKVYKTMSTRLTNPPLPFTFQFLVTTSGTPEQLTVKRRATTISFTEGGADRDTINDSANGFLIAGFQAGDQITVVSTSAVNDGTYTIYSVTAGVITLASRNDLATETAGAAGTVKLTAPKSVPDGISVNIKTRKGNTGDITVGYSSATALNTTTGNVILDANESIGLQVNSTDAIWLDATVTGEGVEVWFEKNIQAA